MENTFIALEQHSHTRWFVFFEGKLKGPMKIGDLALLVQQGKISVAAYVREQQDGAWKRMYDREEFQVLLPSSPGQEICDEAEKLSKEAKGENASLASSKEAPQEEFERAWYVYMQGAQYGPFSVSDLKLMVNSGRVNESTYFWKKGMDDWAFADAVPGLDLPVQKVKPKPSERRENIRKPCEVKVLFTDGKEVAWAIGRDISVGGMQVLTNNIPGEIGTKLELNVSVSSDFPAFACKGKIVRILEDRRGFSFCFSSISDEVKERLREYAS